MFVMPTARISTHSTRRLINKTKNSKTHRGSFFRSFRGFLKLQKNSAFACILP